jgi:hypothetical protein
MWRGSAVTILRDVPFSALYWSLYEAGTPLARKAWARAFHDSAGGGRGGALPLPLLRPPRVELSDTHDHSSRHTGGSGPNFEFGAPAPPTSSSPSAPSFVALSPSSSSSSPPSLQSSSLQSSSLQSSSLQSSSSQSSSSSSSDPEPGRRAEPETRAERFGVPLLAGATSGAMAALVTTPADVLKTRVQTAAAEACRCGGSGPGALQTARFIWAREGAAGFFRGAGPRLLRVTPACAVMISTYEAAKRFFGDAAGGGR